MASSDLVDGLPHSQRKTSPGAAAVNWTAKAAKLAKAIAKSVFAHPTRTPGITSSAFGFRTRPFGANLALLAALAVGIRWSHLGNLLRPGKQKIVDARGEEMHGETWNGLPHPALSPSFEELVVRHGLALWFLVGQLGFW